jgi:DNA polymerase III alpha subunit
VFEQIIDQHRRPSQGADMGVMTCSAMPTTPAPVFDERVAIPDVEFDKMTQKLAFEKEMLGLYVSDHPLMGAEGAAPRRTDCTIAELAECDDGADAHRRRRRHQPAAQVDQEGRPHGGVRARGPAGTSIEVMVFPKTMTEHGHKLADDAVVLVKARRRAGSTSATTCPSSSPWTSSHVRAGTAVARSHRHQGIGSALTSAALDLARAQGAQIAWLQSTPDGEGVYTRLGFVAVASFQVWLR